MSIETDTDIRDITIIGAGPVGLCTAFWAGMREATARIVDSLPEIGGQLTTLYPEKWIFDVPGHPRVLARDLVAQLREQIEPFHVPIHLETTAESISYEGEDDSFAVECDAILLQLGFSTKLGPLKEWGFELEKNAIKVSPTFETSLERVWACGDITTFDGKIKLIATGFGEAAVAVGQAVHLIRPDMKLQPAYSTNTGVPGGVEGQP